MTRVVLELIDKRIQVMNLFYRHKVIEFKTVLDLSQFLVFVLHIFLVVSSEQLNKCVL